MKFTVWQDRKALKSAHYDELHFEMTATLFDDVHVIDVPFDFREESLLLLYTLHVLSMAGSLRATARILGVSVPTLSRRIKKHLHF